MRLEDLARRESWEKFERECVRLCIAEEDILWFYNLIGEYDRLVEFIKVVESADNPRTTVNYSPLSRLQQTDPDVMWQIMFGVNSNGEFTTIEEVYKTVGLYRKCIMKGKTPLVVIDRYRTGISSGDAQLDADIDHWLEVTNHGWPDAPENDVSDVMNLLGRNDEDQDTKKRP